MPIRSAKLFETVSYQYGPGKTADAVVLAKQSAAPGTPTSSASATGGQLATGSYTYRITAIIDGIETPASAAKTQEVTSEESQGSVTLDWSTIVGSAPFDRATAFKVYGRTSPHEYLATVEMPTTSYVDTGEDEPEEGVVPPAATSAVLLKLIHLKQLISAPVATGLKQVGRYYKR